MIPVDSALPPRQPTLPAVSRAHTPSPRLPRLARLARLALSTLLLATLPPPSTAASDSTPATPDHAPASHPSASQPTHWSFQPVTPPPPPLPGHPVDAFVTSSLRARGLQPAPPAPDRDLVRRLHFDLIGLPPTPEAIEAFTRDPRPDRWERLIDHLLAQPQYGERWGRHWLDAVRFTESTGFEYDRLRDNAWPYRDYVIRAFNTDKPYDRFIHEQIAGDTVEPLTSDGLLGPSLLVCGAYDQAGNAQANATQRTITREEELEDLVGTVGQTFLGLTLNCARCHDHKFDPIPLSEYYRIKSVFDGVLHGERPIQSADDLQALENQRSALRRELDSLLDTRTGLESEGTRLALAKRPQDPAPVQPRPAPASFLRWDFNSPAATGGQGEPHGGATLANSQLQLPAAGAYFQSAPLSRDLREKTLEVWVSLDTLAQGGGAAISLENADGSVFDAIVFGERQPGKWTAGSEGFSRTRDLEAPPESTPAGTFIHVAIAYHPDNRIAIYRNGEPYGEAYSSGNPIPTFKKGDARITLGRRHQGGERPWLTGAIRHAALYDRALTPAEVAASFRAHATGVTTAEALAALPPDDRARHTATLARINALRTELAALDKPRNLAYAGRRTQPPPTRVFKRGDVKSPGDIVSPGALSAVQTLPHDFGLAPDAPEAERRRRFADWLIDPRNPLPARVMANRVWQLHFGQGLVATPNDFGAGGAKPSHPELLDWLAHHLVTQGWSLKALHRVICSSATYRQSAEARPEAVAMDADNTLLWRFPPRRLEAEALRDAMLAVSGQLNPQVGGPSFRPFTTTDFNATFYHPFDSGEPEFNRRTVYRMNVNSGKDPLLDAFDCPDPSVKTPRRGVTTTPLQALGLMNGSFVQRQAHHLALRALHATRHDLPAAIQSAYRLALGRPAAPEESQRALQVARDRGLTPVCWALLNSTEFVYVQ